VQGAAATFTNLTLLVPGSIRVGGLAGLYDATSIAKLGLDHQVTMLEKRMVALDSEARIVTLEDGSTLPYEALVLCPGLQDQTRARLGIAPHDQVPVYTLADILTDLTADEASQLQGVVVYGSTLDATSCVTTLLSRGVREEAILHVQPPGAAPVASTLVQAALDAARQELEGEAAGEAATTVAVEKDLTLTRVDFDEGGAAAVFAPMQADAEPVVMGCVLRTPTPSLVENRQAC
jgi:2-polyprenyl-6-methoxyphenol hydroxylase-like FAD-dependent oxidoreductase